MRLSEDFAPPSVQSSRGKIHVTEQDFFLAGDNMWHIFLLFLSLFPARWGPVEQNYRKQPNTPPKCANGCQRKKKTENLPHAALCASYVTDLLSVFS